jgi:nucleoside-diphosphate-sugar epimerase
MKALVIGGTGPSGPSIVNGLIERGYEVSVLHGGQHEVEFIQPVEHIHTDPHFLETLESNLNNRQFDVTIATYGRIRIISEVLKGKTDRLITVSGSMIYAPRDSEEWGPMGAPVSIPENSPIATDPNGPRLPYMIWVTEQEVIKAHHEGHYNATIFRYPQIYGPNAPANPEWSIIRRMIDNRENIVVSSGRSFGRRSFGKNAGHSVLLGVDKPQESSGQIYNVGEEIQFSQRQIVEFIASLLKYKGELIDMPAELSVKIYKGNSTKPRAISELDISKIKLDLGYNDIVSVPDALTESTNWLLENRPEPGGEIEQQLGDPFAYDAEDEMIRLYKTTINKAEKIIFPEINSGHMYRHPSKPGEAWAPPKKK